MLTQRLRDNGPSRIEDLRKFALFETVYREEHVIRALKPLADQGAITNDRRGSLLRSSIVALAPTSAQ
jgi:hypothetical protein